MASKQQNTGALLAVDGPDRDGLEGCAYFGIPVKFKLGFVPDILPGSEHAVVSNHSMPVEFGRIHARKTIIEVHRMELRRIVEDVKKPGKKWWVRIVSDNISTTAGHVRSGIIIEGIYDLQRRQAKFQIVSQKTLGGMHRVAEGVSIRSGWRNAGDVSRIMTRIENIVEMDLPGAEGISAISGVLGKLGPQIMPAVLERLDPKWTLWYMAQELSRDMLSEFVESSTIHQLHRIFDILLYGDRDLFRKFVTGLHNPQAQRLVRSLDCEQIYDLAEGLSGSDAIVFMHQLSFDKGILEEFLTVLHEAQDHPDQYNRMLTLLRVANVAAGDCRG